MSKDIRSFFNPIPKKNAPSNALETQKKKKKVQRIIDSDDDDIIECTPETSKVKPIINRKKCERVNLVSSDSEDEPQKKRKKPPKPEQKLKLVNINDVFSNKPIKQATVESLPKGAAVKVEEKPKRNKTKAKKSKLQNALHDDEAFEETLKELDDDLLIDNLDTLDKTVAEALNIETKSNKPIKHESEKEKHLDQDEQPVESSKSKKKKIVTNSDEDFKQTLQQLDAEIIQNKDMNKKPKTATKDNVKQDSLNESCTTNSKDKTKTKRQRSPSVGSTPKKAKLEQTDSGIDPDQEAFEKKRYSAMLYQKYKNRAGPKMLGQKELPKGKPNCLDGLTFLRTGVLDSLDGEGFESLISEHGGRVVHAVSKKVNYLVVGEEPGPAKLAKARGYNIPEINEDELLDLILVKSKIKPKYCKKVSEESGVFSSDNEEDMKSQKDLKKLEGIKKEKLNQSEEKTSKKKDKHSNSPKKKKITSPETQNSKTRLNKDNEKEMDTKSSFWQKTQKHSEPSNKEETITTSRFYASPKKTDKENEEKQSKNEISPTSKLPSTNETSTKADVSSVESESSLTWTEKYKPTDIKSIIGQYGDNSNLNKLKKWLSNWYKNQLPEVRKKIPRPSPWAKNDDGAYYKAALLSGPPGVGKTTSATLVSKELGFDIVEFNASDTRSKKLLQEEVSQLLSTTTIAGFAAGKSKTDKKRVLLMDEVDGMAGNEDRGGIQELISLIKSTHVPIICMCNDRNHQKMRTLVNYCFDLRFSKPKLEQIRGAMMSICFKEGLIIKPDVLSEIILGTGCDIRQTLNHLTIWSAQKKNITVEEAQNKAQESKKDTVLGPWEVVKLVFTESEQKKMSLIDKSRLFFYDYSMGPLFVQENYLAVTPKCPKSEVMKRVALAADSISMGDLIDAKIRSSNNWSLLETQAMYSSVLPGHYMSGYISGKINFPGWLGKNSVANKRKRMLSELHVHTRMSISGSVLAMNLDYLMPLRNAIITPLIKHGTDGILQSIEVMNNYNLLREDLNSILELCQWKGSKNPFNDLNPKVKTAFTKTYNKMAPKLPFAPSAGFSKKVSRGSNLEGDVSEFESDGDDDQEEKDDVAVDSLIKVGKGSKKQSTKASTSKTKEPTKGRGKNKKGK